MGMCGICPGKKAVYGGFYCSDCHARWDKEDTDSKIQKQNNEIEALREEIAELKGR